jgi:hypothetical protein
MFTEQEFTELLAAFVGAGMGKNKAQLTAALGRWIQTKGDFLGWVMKNAAAKEGQGKKE